jgi:dihydrodipicolinate reductase
VFAVSGRRVEWPPHDEDDAVVVSTGAEPQQQEQIEQHSSAAAKDHGEHEHHHARMLKAQDVFNVEKEQHSRNVFGKGVLLLLREIR